MVKQADKIFVIWSLKFSNEVQVILSREFRSMSSFRNVQYTSRTEERRGFGDAALAPSPSQVLRALLGDLGMEGRYRVHVPA